MIVSRFLAQPGSRVLSDVNRPQAVMLHSGKNVKSREEREGQTAVSTAGRSSTSPAIAAKREKKQSTKPRMRSHRRGEAGERRVGGARGRAHGRIDTAGGAGWQGKSGQPRQTARHFQHLEGTIHHGGYNTPTTPTIAARCVMAPPAGNSPPPRGCVFRPWRHPGSGSRRR